MKNAFSPGPWMVSNQNFVVSSTGQYIADCNTFVCNVLLDKANAQLIAAAPDLLEAAKLVAPCIPLIIAMGMLTAAETDTIRAAIAKATGVSL